MEPCWRRRGQVDPRTMPAMRERGDHRCGGGCRSLGPRRGLDGHHALRSAEELVDKLALEVREPVVNEERGRVRVVVTDLVTLLRDAEARAEHQAGVVEHT